MDWISNMFSTSWESMRKHPHYRTTEKTYQDMITENWLSIDITEDDDDDGGGGGGESEDGRNGKAKSVKPEHKTATEEEDEGKDDDEEEEGEQVYNLDLPPVISKGQQAHHKRHNKEPYIQPVTKNKLQNRWIQQP